MRTVVVLVCLAGIACSSNPRRVEIAIPPLVAGRVRVEAVAVEPVGEVQPIALAVTNGSTNALRLDRSQVFTYSTAVPNPETDTRTAPLTPAEAARRAEGSTLPGIAGSSARGAAEGGLKGAASGAVTGGGGIGGLVGAVVGAIGGAFRGGAPPDISGFEDRAIHDLELREGFSSTGYVYFPRGDYRSLEVILVGDHEVARVIVPVAPPSN